MSTRRAARARGLRRADRARRRLPVRDQGPPGPRRPAHPRPRRRRASSSAGCSARSSVFLGCARPSASTTSMRPPPRRSGCCDAFLETGDVGDDPGVRPLLELARDEIVPKLRATPNELDGADRRPARPPRPAGPVRLAHPRPARRPARPAATCTRSTRARCRPSSPTRPASSSPTRCWRPRRAPGDRRDRRLGHGRDAHRAATTRARSSRCSASGPRWHAETRRIAGLEVDPAGGARPPADRRHRPHLGLLPRRLPAPGRAARRGGHAGRGPRRADRAELRPQARAGRRRRARGRLARRDRADLRRAPRHVRHRHPAARRRRATGATTPTSPRSTRPGAATPTAAAWTAAEARQRDAPPVRPHRRRGQERRHARARPARLAATTSPSTAG